MTTFKHSIEHPSSGLSDGDTRARLAAHTTTWWMLGAGFSLAIGAWLLVAHRAFNLPMTEAAARNDQVVGAFSIALTLISLFKSTRPVRLGNAILGYWLMISTWFMDGGTLLGRWNSTAAAVALILMSVPLGMAERSRFAPR